MTGPFDEPEPHEDAPRVDGDRTPAEQEALHRAIVENMTDIVTVVGADGTYRYESPSVERVTGFRPGERLGRDVLLYIHPDDRALVREALREAMANPGRTKTIEYRSRRQDGSWRVLQSAGINLLDDPAVRGVLAVSRDVSEVRRAEAALRESEAHKALVLESLPLAFYRARAEGDFGGLWVSDQILALTGFSAREFTEDTGLWARRLHPDDAGRVLARFEALPETGRLEAEYRWRTRSGEYRWFRDVAVSKGGAGGSPTDVIGVWTDVTEQRAGRAALEESERKYRALFEAANDGIFLMRGPRFVDCNERAVRILGWTREELLGRTPWDISPPVQADGRPSREAATALVRRALDGESIVFDWTHLAQDGTSVAVEVSLSAVELGGETHVLALLRDMRERKRAQEEVAAAAAQNRRLSVALENAAEAVVVADREGGIEYVNPAFERVLGYSADAVLGASVRMLDDGENPSPYSAKGWEMLAAGQAWSGRMTVRRADGVRVVQDGTVSPIRDAEGAITGYVSVSRDVTEQVALERQLQTAQKMQAIGTLAGGLAHDFNNILGALAGFVELAHANTAEGSQEREDLEEALQAADRARRLVRQILTVARPAEGERRPIALKHVVREALGLLRASLPATIELCARIEPTGSVVADPTQIHQVVVNLCTNAHHAMRDHGGTLRVTLESIVVGAEGGGGRAEGSVPIPAGRHVRLTVSDTGTGMDAATLERAFDPYFTTKQPGEGTGLGLAMVRGIVHDHGGVVTVDSRVGRGTTVQILLPEVDIAAERDEARGEEPPRGAGRILFVDDERPLLVIGRRVLEGLGYEVETHERPEAALAALRAAPARFDVLLTDLLMPGMTGVELARAVGAIRPDLPIVLVTGNRSALPADAANVPGVIDIVDKPLLRAHVAAAVGRALGRGDTGPGSGGEGPFRA